MGQIAIIGAAGFVGSRLIETCILTGKKEFYPIVRNSYNLARLCRYGLKDRVRIADAENEVQLLDAVNGCQVVVNLMSGDPYGIIETTKVIHKACIKLGVKRLIHLSSAVVYGQVESASTHDDSPLETNHWMPYARAKIEAEHYLKAVGGNTSLEIAVLRPGIVWGPRSRWSFSTAVALKENTGFLVGDGLGICNSIYIDNLVACILKCCTHHSDITGFFNVADKEVVTWRDFYASLSDHLGYDMSNMRKVVSDHFELNFDNLIQDMKSTSFYLKLKKGINPEMRARIKQWLAALNSLRTTSNDPENSQVPKLSVSREMWNLQKTFHKLPTNKFAKRFDFCPPVSFCDGTQMTINWLKFIQYNEWEKIGK